MDRGQFIGNTTTNPTGNPLAGVFLYSNSGVLTVRQPDGTIIPIAAGGTPTFDDVYNNSGVNPTITVDNGEVIWTLDGGTIPALSADTAMVWVNSSAVGDNIAVSLIAGTSGLCTINLGDSADENPARMEYDNSAGTLRFLTGAFNANITLTSTETVFNEDSAIIDFRVEGNTLIRLLATDASSATENVILVAGGAPNFQTMDRGIFIGDVSTAPTAGGSGGLFMWSAASVLSLAGGMVINELGLDTDFRVEGDTLQRLLATDGSAATENVIICADAAPDFKTMDRGYFLGDVTTAPTGDPVAGIFVWSGAGVGTARAGGGTVTVWADSRPHCEICGSDFWTVAKMNMNWKSWCFICGMCGTEYKGGPQNVLNQLTPKQKTELIRKTSTWQDVKDLIGVVS